MRPDELKGVDAPPAVALDFPRGARVRPEPIRACSTYDVCVMGGHRAHVSISRYADGGGACEIFVNVGGVGSDLRTSYEAWAMTASKALQHGTPLSAIASSIRGVKDDHGGKIKGGGEASSLWDAIAQALEAESE